MAALAILIALLFRWRHEGFDWSLFATTFRRLNPGWLLAATVLGLATYYGRVLRWAVLMRPVCSRPNLWGLFSATAIGFSAIVVFGRPGEIVRPYLISLRERVPFSSQAAAWLLERMYDMLAALLIFGIALSQVEKSGANLSPAFAFALEAGGRTAAVIGFTCLAILLLLRQFAEPARKRLTDALKVLPEKWHKGAEELVCEFVRGIQSTRDLPSLILTLFYTALEWALIAACYIALFRAFPGLSSFNIRDILIFMGFVSFGSVLQLPGIGGGMQLVAMVVLTELFRVPLELATGMALLIWLFTFVVILPVGAFMLCHEGLTWQKIKLMEDRATL
ncbi:MAG: lysylphosphatidylglycerol synthase transmembrane domain-containing protein [Bryobacteraceae bacterium]